ncbi:UDP-2,3-diacylglucosamine diphosphatase [Albibacterium sp.]|uniref:UDP-2,3-diacylglucosamine diphosphatase n=1 Tax=Albibacterium sp. TaxID=2952885 RepID=UPI002C567790|nr:UDP-2,3-diacylglucosamine diphosphatase [Albibacterium sp.]HUH20041.1 UDP-2,3-diacylglucosamine diphosphatase [Albibacterium sp.]
MPKREIDLVVISDVHLGTYGCHAKELIRYLKSIQPKKLILNGDIIDIWQFSKSYWPDSHMKVLRRIMKMASEGTSVYYITGNHDEMLRKFVDLKMGNFRLVNKLILNLRGNKAWFFHGDIFDVTMQNSKWLAKLGAVGYDSLILINSFVNWCLTAIGKEKMSFSQRIKKQFKNAVKFINDFENTAADLAIDKGYTYVVCGHIHQPEIREIESDKGKVLYLNSGDWVESLTALEYHKGQWDIFKYKPEDFKNYPSESDDILDNQNLNSLLDIKSLLSQIS